MSNKQAIRMWARRIRRRRKAHNAAHGDRAAVVFDEQLADALTAWHFVRKDIDRARSGGVR